MAASTWPHWELQFLKTAGLPTTDANHHWLSLWQQYERTTCERNPVNTWKPETGSTRCKRLPNSKYARAYASRDTAAQAFAEQLNLTDYPELRKAFLGGDPESYSNQDGILLDLQKWGSTRWRQQVAAMTGVPIGTTGSDPSVTGESNVSGAWTHLHRILEREGGRTVTELQRSTAALRRIERRLRRV